MTPEQMSQYEDLLPEGGLPMSGFRLLSYINSKGQICYQFSQAGDVAVSQFLGLIELAKMDILNAHSQARRGARNDD